MSTLYSHSRLASFEKCPKQFHYRYVLRIPSETESIEAFVGKRVHEVLERLYRAATDGRIPRLEAVLRRYLALFREQFDPARIRRVRTELPPSFYQQLGERCLENYYRRNYPFDADETLGVEERLRFSLDAAGNYRFQGVVDRIARARDGVVEIHDYKTAQRVPPQRVLDRDRQLALYQLGAAERYGPEQPFRLVWHFLARDVVRVSTRTPQQLERLRGSTVELIDRIGAEREFAARPGPLCAWCEYTDRCPDSAHRPTEAARDVGPVADDDPAPAASPAPAAEPPRATPSEPRLERRGQLRLL